MEACFREMHRILKRDGVLTVMFTHKKVEAWDTLGAALIGAGFRVHSSWPVHTEFEHSLHQARKSAAASTVLLSARKRVDDGDAVWWEDIKSRVRETARERATEYEQLGIRGADLYIATFGPVLSVISERWPVLTSEVDPKTNRPKPLRPELALEIAREEVIGLRKRGLLLGREVRFDPTTDWYLMAWDAFRAEEFPADEARKLAIALGLDLEETVVRAKHLVAKKGQTVVLQQPKARRRRGMVDPDLEVFDTVLDAAHTAMLIFDEDGAHACERWLRQRGLDRDAPLRACFQAMANAIPITKSKGTYIRPEMALLDRMNDALGLEITFQVETVPDLSAFQRSLFGRTDADQDGEDVEDEEAEDEDER
jgi:adenine-specific DNA methylase